MRQKPRAKLRLHVYKQAKLMHLILYTARHNIFILAHEKVSLCGGERHIEMLVSSRIIVFADFLIHPVQYKVSQTICLLKSSLCRNLNALLLCPNPQWRETK
jgi:hypothetical protein